MNVNDVVRTYLTHRQSKSVADAASATIEQLSITAALLVDAFNEAQLDMSRPDEEAREIWNHRNELLSHFNSQK